jgi:hypothetical protein
MHRVITQFAIASLVCASCLAFCAASTNVQVKQSHSDGLFVIIVNDKRGYIDRTGKVLIEPQFQGANKFSEGLAVVTVGGVGYKEGYIDRTGKLVIAARFDAARDFHEGLAAVGFDTEKTRKACDDCDPNQHWGYVDSSGAIVIKPQYHHAGDFFEGLAAVETDDGRWGFIDKSGRVVVNLKYDYASRFSEGLACVMTDKKFSYVDHNGRMAIEPRFSRCSDFSEGLARVRIGGKATSPVLLTSVSGKPGKLRYIDKTGHIAIRLDAESGDDFSEGLASFEVKKPDGYLYCGYLDATGKTIVSPQFGECGKFSDGLALILLNGKWGYIDRSGKVLFTTPYAIAWDFSDGLAQVQLGGLDPFKPPKAKYGYIDIKGTLVWEPTN